MSQPRLPPCPPREMGLGNAIVAWFYGRRLGVRSLPHVFTTLAHNRRLFRPYLAFAYRLMPAGTLPRAETELVILRTAENAGSEYEWHHHSRIGRRAGLSDVEVERIREGWRAAGWSPRQAVLLKAVDELYQDHCLLDETWSELSHLLDNAQIIELCLLVGNYRMLAMLLLTLRVQIERAGPE